MIHWGWLIVAFAVGFVAFPIGFVILLSFAKDEVINPSWHSDDRP